MSSDVTNRGSGIYFDGLTSRRHAVDVYLDPSVVRIVGESIYTRWPYEELEHLSGPEGLLRLGRLGAQQLERLEVRDHDLAAAIDERSVPVDRTGAAERRLRGRAILWSLAAVIALVLMAIYGVPALADRIAPYVPHALEAWMGEAIDAQVRTMLDTKGAGAAFECGAGRPDHPGRRALGNLVGHLEGAARLPIPLHVAVVRKSEANAIALPGGHIYVFEGLIAKAQSADEIAGVIAHEIGHVAHRDGTRAVLQTAGISFLFGMLLGDFVGGGAVVVAAKTVLNSSYSRGAEARADQYGVELMNNVGGDARALGTFLQRIDGSTHPGIRILLDHPDTQARIKAIEAAAKPKSGTVLLTEADWAALKTLCGDR